MRKAASIIAYIYSMLAIVAAGLLMWYVEVLLIIPFVTNIVASSLFIYFNKKASSKKDIVIPSIIIIIFGGLSFISGILCLVAPESAYTNKVKDNVVDVKEDKIEPEIKFVEERIIEEPKKVEVKEETKPNPEPKQKRDPITDNFKHRLV